MKMNDENVTLSVSMELMVKKKRQFASSVVRDTLDWIEIKLAEPISVSGIAARAGYSRWHFQKIFQEVTGLSVAAYVRKRRIESAAWLLKNSDKSTSDIYFAVGFENRASFFRAFRQHFNTAPVRYRKHYQSGNVR